tara:strand:+ start:4896 stop:5270 length:375 start_codon:yes stop_codon:yes gene_type:complete
MSKRRDFKGVWIPKEIWLSPDLGVVEKVLLAEISSLDNEDGCWASNDYFAKFLGVSTKTISRGVQSLQDKGYIDSKTKVIVKEGGQAFERIIRAKGVLKRKIDKGMLEIVEVDGQTVARVVGKR